MSFRKNSPFFNSSFNDMNNSFWKGRSPNDNRGDINPWNNNSPSRSFNSDQGNDYGSWNFRQQDNFPSLSNSRSGFNSSNQVNSQMYGNFSAPSNQFAPYRRPNVFNSVQQGRIVKNNTMLNPKAKRILQKKALNTAVPGALVANVKRKKNLQTPQQAKIKTAEDANKSETEVTNKPSKNPRLNLAIGWVNPKKENLNFEQVQLIKKKLEQLLDEQPIPDNGHVPRFITSGMSSGMFKIQCLDEESAEWVRESVASFGELWEGANLKVFQSSELEGQIVTIIISKQEDAEFITLLNRIEKQNSEISTEKWRLNRETYEEFKRILLLSIDGKSNMLIQKNGGKIFLGLRQITVIQGKVAPKPPTEKKNLSIISL